MAVRLNAWLDIWLTTRTMFAPMFQQLCIARCHLKKHLKRKYGARNNTFFINFLTIKIWIRWNFDIYYPPNLYLFQKPYEKIELHLVRRFLLTGYNLEQPMRKLIASFLQLFKIFKIGSTNNIVLLKPFERRIKNTFV